MAVITCPVEVVPLYEASLIKQISASIETDLNKSDANIKEPFSTAINKGFLPEYSVLISAANAAIFSWISASGKNISKLFPCS